MVLIKKIIPFEKELLFKTKISDITSISLEHKINKKEEDLISGVFVISGEYKMTEGSIVRNKFSFDVGFDIALDNRYDTSNLVIDIDNFTYDIVNDDMLRVNIDLFIEGDLLKEDSIVVSNDKINKDVLIDKEDSSNNIILEDEFRDSEEEDNNIIISENILGNISETETYSTYYVYIVKEEDTIDKVMEKYNVTRDDLSLYNVIEDIKPGDKIIIPTCNNG